MNEVKAGGGVITHVVLEAADIDAALDFRGRPVTFIDIQLHHISAGITNEDGVHSL